MIRAAVLALALALLLAVATVEGSAPHHIWIAEAFERLPVSEGDRSPARAPAKAAQTSRFVEAIARVSRNAPRPPREWSALLLTLGSAESNFDSEVVEGRCPPRRCDVRMARGVRMFLARGAFQQHRVSFLTDLWEVSHGSPEIQVEMADRTLRRSLTRCAPFGPYPGHVFRAYGGSRSCSVALRDEPRRVALYSALMSR